MKNWTKNIWTEFVKTHFPFAIWILVFIFLCSSCKIHKDLQKSKTEVKTEVRAEEKTNTEIQTVNQTTSTTEADTMVITREEKKINSVSQADLDKGNPVLIDNGDSEIEFKKDLHTGVISSTVTVKPKVIPIHIKQTIVSNTQENKEIKQEKKTASKTNTITETKSLKKDVSGGLNLNYLWWLLLLIPILIWRYRKFLFG